jgi:hypothetical protein
VGSHPPNLSRNTRAVLVAARFSPALFLLSSGHYFQSCHHRAARRLTSAGIPPPLFVVIPSEPSDERPLFCPLSVEEALPNISAGQMIDQDGRLL